MDHDAATITAALDASTDTPQTYRVSLGAADSAWDPTSTGTSLWGPGWVLYQRYNDGGVSATYTSVGALAR